MTGIPSQEVLLNISPLFTLFVAFSNITIQSASGIPSSFRKYKLIFAPSSKWLSLDSEQKELLLWQHFLDRSRGVHVSTLINTG